MNTKTKRTLEKINADLKKKKSFSMYFILTVMISSVLLSAIAFNALGHKEGYQQKEAEINAQEVQNQQTNMMEKPLNDIWESFLKYLMIKTMYWLPWIVGALLLGWVLHGIF